MSKVKSWILTDVEKNLWVDSIFLGHDELGVPDCTVSKRTLRGGLRDGVEVIEVNNGHMSYIILPTRGMGLWRGAYRGIDLGWDSPVKGPVHPKFVHLAERGGLGWLQGFDEWLVRCGLDSNGAPGEDVIQDNEGNPAKVTLTLHGKIANLPAHYVEVRADPATKTVSVIGHVDEAAMFSPSLRLKTTLSTTPMSNRLVVSDEIVNLRGQPSELEILYHWNFSKPFLEAGSRMIAPIVEGAPRNANAARSVQSYDTYLPPTPGYVEQVYFFELAGKSGTHETLVALENAAGNRAAVLRFNSRQLPYLSQWKNSQAEVDGYVTGIEPGTNFPNPKRFEREKGRVVRIEPGKSYRCEQAVEIYNDSEEVKKIRQEIARLQEGKTPLIHSKPNPKFS